MRMWIEMIVLLESLVLAGVILRVRMWIEIWMSEPGSSIYSVILRVRMWIEIDEFHVLSSVL